MRTSTQPGAIDEELELEDDTTLDEEELLEDELTELEELDELDELVLTELDEELLEDELELTDELLDGTLLCAEAMLLGTLEESDEALWAAAGAAYRMAAARRVRRTAPRAAMERDSSAIRV